MKRHFNILNPLVGLLLSVMILLAACSVANPIQPRSHLPIQTTLVGSATTTPSIATVNRFRDRVERMIPRGVILFVWPALGERKNPLNP